MTPQLQEELYHIYRAYIHNRTSKDNVSLAQDYIAQFLDIKEQSFKNISKRMFFKQAIAETLLIYENVFNSRVKGIYTISEIPVTLHKEQDYFEKTTLISDVVPEMDFKNLILKEPVFFYKSFAGGIVIRKKQLEQILLILELAKNNSIEDLDEIEGNDKFVQIDKGSTSHKSTTNKIEQELVLTDLTLNQGNQDELLIKNNTHALEEIKEIIKPLSGVYMGKKLLNKEEYKRLVSYIKNIITDNYLPENTKSFTHINLTYEFIRKTIHLVYVELGKKNKDEFVKLVHLFPHFKDTELTTTNKKFSEFIKDYNKLKNDITI